MSIIDSDSVLILGAGVSAPFGLSLGGDLIEDVAVALESEISTKVTSVAPKLLKMQPKEAFGLSPIGCAFEAAGNNFDGFEAAARELIARLRSSTHDTIDDFIVDNPSLAPLTKLGVCSALFLQSYDKVLSEGSLSFWDGKTLRKTECYRLRDFTQRKLGEKRNWTHHFINMIRFAVRQDRLDKPVSVITFNYDTVLESVMSDIFRDTEYDYLDFDKYVNFAHVHGAFGKLEHTIHEPASIVANWAQKICVVQEKQVSESVEIDRQKALEWIEQSRKIYAVGFAFSGANCRLLGLESLRGRIRELFYCNYDGNMGITQSVERIFGPTNAPKRAAGQYKVFPATGSRENPVSVEDWFASGYAGETPA